jgi:hypothetical protein
MVRWDARRETMGKAVSLCLLSAVCFFRQCSTVVETAEEATSCWNVSIVGPIVNGASFCLLIRFFYTRLAYAHARLSRPST